jgi:hypothetical protein
VPGPAYYQEIKDQFSATVTGTVDGVAVTQNSGAMGFWEEVGTPLPAGSPATVQARSAATEPLAVQPVSELLAKSAKASDKALRRLRALERAQKAYIAQRKGDHLGNER